MPKRRRHNYQISRYCAVNCLLAKSCCNSRKIANVFTCYESQFIFTLPHLVYRTLFHSIQLDFCYREYYFVQLDVPMAGSKKRKMDSESRKFQKRWENEHFFTEYQGKCVCLICKETITVRKEYNLRRHFQSKHQVYASFTGAEREQKIKLLSSSLKKRKIDSECRKFQKRWENEHFFIEYQGQCVCLICQETVAVKKEYNLRRHYQAKHLAYESYTGAEREQRVKLLASNLEAQHNFFRSNIGKCDVIAAMPLHQTCDVEFEFDSTDYCLSVHYNTYLKQSKFDARLKKLWTEASKAGICRYEIPDLNTKVLPGKYGLVVQVKTFLLILWIHPTFSTFYQP